MRVLGGSSSSGMVSGTLAASGKLFRRRFRVPHFLFRRLVRMFEDNNWSCASVNRAGKAAKPLELKILSSLRVLGRGECFDTCRPIADREQGRVHTRASTKQLVHPLPI